MDTWNSLLLLSLGFLLSLSPQLLHLDLLIDIVLRARPL